MRKDSQISSGKQIAQRPATINEHVIATELSPRFRSAMSEGKDDHQAEKTTEKKKVASSRKATH